MRPEPALAALPMLAAVLLAYALGTFGPEIGRGPATSDGTNPIQETTEERSDRSAQEVEVRFASGTPGVELAGTIRLPHGIGPFPGVVLLSGAGPQDRDGTLAGHRRYHLLAEAFAKQGIASLRFDDRGVGQSTGDLVSIGHSELIADARAALFLLAEQPKVDALRVGLLGASQGGIVAVKAAAQAAEDSSGTFPQPAFLILVSTPIRSTPETLLEQNLVLAELAGIPMDETSQGMDLMRKGIEVVRSQASKAAKREKLEPIVEALVDLGPVSPVVSRRRQTESQLSMLLSPSFRDDLEVDLRPLLRASALPILGLFGSLDRQIDAPSQAAMLRAELAARSAAAGLQTLPAESLVEVLPSLNHLLQPATTGAPAEYSTISVPIADYLPHKIAQWVADQTASPVDVQPPHPTSVVETEPSPAPRQESEQ